MTKFIIDELENCKITSGEASVLQDIITKCGEQARIIGWIDKTDKFLENPNISVDFKEAIKDGNIGKIISLIHSEISEAFEAYRKNADDDHLPHRKGFEVELADAIIRIFDLAHKYDLDIVGAMIEKLIYNQHREDHKPENSSKIGGKRF